MSKVRRAIEIVTPVIVALLFVFVVVTALNRADDRAQQARVSQVKACAAVKGSNDALEKFLKGRQATTPALRTEKGVKFLADLHTAYVKAEKQCLVKP